MGDNQRMADVVDVIVADHVRFEALLRALRDRSRPDLGTGPTVQLWPHRHGTDAMFLALLRRGA